MDFERTLIDKRLAAKYRCNVPVDSAGVMYNMIELVPDKKQYERTTGVLYKWGTCCYFS